MRIKLLKTIVVQGHPGVRAGDIFEVKDQLGGYLIGCRWAVEVKDDPQVIQAREPVNVEHRDPGFSAANVPAIPVKTLRRGRSKLY